MARVLMLLACFIGGCAPRTVTVETPIGNAVVSEDQIEKFDLEAFRADQEADFEDEQEWLRKQSLTQP